MNQYNFLNLSPVEFENLSRDLLQKHLNITLESFTSGRDGGIDFRYSKSSKNNIIVQCKRYSDTKLLIRELKKEVSKVKNINPDKYILTTSAPLTKTIKDLIKNLFKPYIKEMSDIYGKDDLNNLLGTYQDVESRHFKLWISSTNVLNKILHSKVLNHSLIKEEEIKENMNVFVENDSLEEALNIVKEHNYVIISGIPGIGKTTLARMLALYFIGNGFDEFIYLSESINDGLKLLDPTKKQIFFFDDFLGSNFLETRISTNEEKRIIDFISNIKKSKNQILILTSREYILNQAKGKFEAFNNEKINIAKCVIDLEKYTKMVRAKILYNHLFFSELGQEYIDDILENHNYFEIINHKNYSPRIIEQMTKIENFKDIPPKDYYNYFRATLNNPEKIWKHSFENDITKTSQYLLYTLSISGTPIFLTDLQDATKKIAEGNNFKFDNLDFTKSIKELEKSFIISKNDGEKNIYVDFLNPSIQDFLINYIREDKKLIETLINNSIYLNQLLHIFSTNDEKYKIILDGDLCKILYKKINREFDELKISSLINVNVNGGAKNYYIRNDNDIAYKLFNIVNDVGINKYIEEMIKDKFMLIDLSKLSSYQKWYYVKILKLLYNQFNLDLDKIIIDMSEDFTNMQDVMNFVELRDIRHDKFEELIQDNDIYDNICNIIFEEKESCSISDIPQLIADIEKIEEDTGIDFEETKRDLNNCINEDNDRWYDAMDDYYTPQDREGNSDIVNLFDSLKNN